MNMETVKTPALSSTTVQYGREAAQWIGRFEGWYPTATGHGPDGRRVTVCDRCKHRITQAYVFFGTGVGRAHVGIDCARKMGLPHDELAAAIRAPREARRAAEEAARKQKEAHDYEAYREAERIAREFRLTEAKATVDQLSAFSTSPHATDWEKRRIEVLLAQIAERGDEFLLTETDSEDSTVQYSRRSFESIRDRLTLCDTSSASAYPEGSEIRDVELRVYRASSQTTYGRVHYLTDGQTAFVYFGSLAVGQGGRVRVTAKIGATPRPYAGLQSVVLKRPKFTVIDP